MRALSPAPPLLLEIGKILIHSTLASHPPVIRSFIVRPLVAVAAAFALQGCASAGQSWRAGPAGIPAENQLREQMVAGQYGTALESLKDKKIAPADALLRHMYRGLVAMHAGQAEIGTRSMDRAWEIAYQRWTKRLSDGAAAMLTGDGALPYDPGPAERMLIPYYGGLNWLQRNEPGEAGVEARRMATFLESNQGAKPNDQFEGLMRYVSGVMFEVAGERNDADVAYRNASKLLGGALPGDTVPPDAAHGDVVIFIEDGFVVRPEPMALDFWINDEELGYLNGDDFDRRIATYHELNRRRGMSGDWAAQRFRNVSIRWPVMGAESMQPASGRVGARATRFSPVVANAAELESAGSFVLPVLGALDEATVQADVISTSISNAVRDDFEREQPARIARAIARAAVREASLKGAEGAFNAAGDILDDEDKKKEKSKDGDKKKDDGDGSGWAAAGAILLGIGLLATHVSSQVLDQPDLRAWQLLPDRVSVARLRLPVGEHVVEVTRDGEAYSLGTVTVKPGAVTVLAHRWWPGGGRGEK